MTTISKKNKKNIQKKTLSLNQGRHDADLHFFFGELAGREVAAARRAAAFAAAGAALGEPLGLGVALAPANFLLGGGWFGHVVVPFGRRRPQAFDPLRHGAFPRRLASNLEETRNTQHTRAPDQKEEAHRYATRIER